MFDAKGKTFATTFIPNTSHIARRCPDDLRADRAALHEAVEAEGWPLLVVDGVEADDVIGTLPARPRRRAGRW